MLTTMLDYIRFSLYAVLIVVALVLYQQWEMEHPSGKTTQLTQPTLSADNQFVPTSIVPSAAQSSTTSQPAAATSTVPAINTAAVAAPETAATTPVNRMVHITTDVLDVTLDTQGGNIIGVKLLQYPESLHAKTPFVLLNDDPQTRYVAQSGLVSTTGPDTVKGQTVYTPEKNEYGLAADQEKVDVVLNWQNDQGIKVKKIYTFQRNSYEVGLSYVVNNDSTAEWNGNVYLQLMRTNTPPPSSGLVNLATYFGAAISSPEKPFQKINFKDMTEKNLTQTINDGWLAMIQHYFISAWVPDKTYTSQYYTRVLPNGLYTVGLVGPAINVKPGEVGKADAKFYAGPATAEKLDKVAPHLDLTIDYGLFWFLSVPIFWLLSKVYSFVGNWGWAIIIVTIIIKLVFYHLSAKSYRSMTGLKKIQPKIDALKERYADDKQKFTQATIELYKKEKVNPMSGCLPILIQIPVFIALYWVLVESVELRQAPFILWIKDLSTKDPFYILPVLMGLSMFLQQRLSPAPPDPTQAKVMMFMPVVFTVLFMNFPAGLMLYWFVNNLLSFAQQWYIMRTMTKEEKAKVYK